MKLILITLLFGLLAIPALAKQDRPLDVGTLSADPNVHQAIYNVLKAKGISCDGLETRKDGIIMIIRASSADQVITTAEIHSEITKIVQTQGIEAKIQAEIRRVAIVTLKSRREIPADYIDVIR